MIKDVSVAYDSAPVIREINLTIKAGTTFGLIGLNGAGKTTLIKAILGLRAQQAGTIEVFGQPCNTSRSRAALAYLPERFEPPWFLSGMEFLKFSLALYDRPFDESVMYEYAEKLALDKDALKRRVKTYSKGMRQKLGLLSTILADCRLLILDEPMSGLDPMARTLVKDMLSLCREKGQTVFLSSHILADMEEICDLVAVLNRGVIQFTGEPAALKKQTSADNLERAFLHFINGKKAA